MKQTPRSLTAHRNTVERRQRRNTQSTMAHAAKAIGEGDVLAYAIVAIRSDGSAAAAWDAGSALPLWAFADTVRGILHEDIMGSGIEDTWRPSLSERKRP